MTNMKKTILTLSALFAAALAFAEVVSPDMAKDAAKTFMTNSGIAHAAKSGALSLAAASSTAARTPGLAICSDEAPSYYIYNIDGGGFVIIAGDDSVDKVLAYSGEGSIDAANMPPAMKWWLGLIDDQVRYARLQNAPRHSSWDDRSKKAGNVIIEHDTAKWDQETPYWNECPKAGNSRTLTGCVATAAAIVCRFHKWPQSGTGTLPAYTTSSRRISIPSFTLGRIYDYDNMPLKYTGYNSQQAAAVAALMYDLGRSAKMDYGTANDGGSGAQTDDLLASLKKYFKFSSKATLETRSRYTDANWIAMLQEELRTNGPIIYGGYESNYQGGHQFVFDGCRDDKYFRVNWGWSGEGDGYFLISKLGGSSIGYEFPLGQDAIVGLVPDGYSADDIMKAVSLSYGRTDSSLTLTSSLDGELDYSLQSLSGDIVAAGKLTGGVQANIHLGKVADGDYTLSLGNGKVKITIKK